MTSTPFNISKENTRSWRPLLKGRSADRAYAAMMQIATDLCSDYSPVDPAEAEARFSLGFGTAGISLFLNYLGRYIPSRLPAQIRATQAIHQSTTGLMQCKMSPGFFRGFLGIAWTLVHNSKWLSSEEAPASQWEEIDNALAEWCSYPDVPLDLMSGICAVLIYVSERMPVPEKLANTTIDQLHLRAVQAKQGMGWPLPKSFIQHMESDHHKLQRTESLISSVHVAHGTMGIAGALSCLHDVPGVFPNCGRTIVSAVEWVLSYLKPSVGPSECNEWFPQFTGIESPRRCSGWCNGDLGISIVLFNIARRLNCTSWEQIALSIARKEAQKSLADVEPHNRNNYGLCHGSAGRAHILNCFFQCTGEEVFATAARFWIEHALGMQGDSGGIGGFVLNEVDGPKLAKGLVTGAAGLALVLMAALTDVKPSWDTAFLMSF